MGWVRCVGGNGNYTDKCWDGSLVPNVYIDTHNGAEISYNSWSATDYINIAGASYIYRSGKIMQATYNAFYDSNKQFISGVNTDSGIDTVPPGAAYVRYSNGTPAMIGKIFISTTNV